MTRYLTIIKSLRFSFKKVLLVLLFLLGVGYVINGWSPSSYGVFLKQFDPDNTGLVWGTPRGIRSDEWGVVTPLTQATVNNGFERFNKTSFYKEDLRINYGLPIFDWGMIFKPTLWGYFFLKPAYAYSLHWYLIFALFILGCFLLFERIGIPGITALSLAITLYFSGFSQFWWNEKGPLFSFFPWIMLILLSKQKPVKKNILYYWLATSWMLTDFYPPVIISLGFVGGLIFIIHGKKDIKNLLVLAISSIGAVATTLFYLKDYLLKTMVTIYPGHRAASGGGVSIQEWISQFLPFSTYNNNFDVFIHSNISEIGAVGLPFILMILCLIDYRRARFDEIIKNKNVFVFLIGLALMNLWMLAPIPSWAGKLFLWDNVQPGRMKYAAGLLLAITFILIIKEIPLIVSWKRLFFYSFLIISGWLATKGVYTHGFHYSESHVDATAIHNCFDLIFIAAMLLTMLAVNYFKLDVLQSVMVSSTLSTAIVMFSFNPLQSSVAIFSEHPFIKEKLDPLVNTKSGILAVPGYFGATLNGLGYKSITHVTAVPVLDLWKKNFPDLKKDELNSIFNRYSHIRLSDVTKPKLVWADAIELPVSLFFRQIKYPARVIETSNVPFVLNHGNSLTGYFVDIPPGSLKSFSVMIGTFSGLSDGILTLTVCNNGKCKVSKGTLHKALDNGFIPLFFDKPMVIDSSKPTYYTFTVSDDATYPTAIWLYKDVEQINKFTGYSTSIGSGISPRIELNYEIND